MAHFVLKRLSLFAYSTHAWHNQIAFTLLWPNPDVETIYIHIDTHACIFIYLPSLLAMIAWWYNCQYIFTSAHTSTMLFLGSCSTFILRVKSKLSKHLPEDWLYSIPMHNPDCWHLSLQYEMLVVSQRSEALDDMRRQSVQRARNAPFSGLRIGVWRHSSTACVYIVWIWLEDYLCKYYQDLIDFSWYSVMKHISKASRGCRRWNRMKTFQGHTIRAYTLTSSSKWITLVTSALEWPAKTKKKKREHITKKKEMTDRNIGNLFSQDNKRPRIGLHSNNRVLFQK